MYRNVLVPLDGSPLAEKALAAAVAICRRSAARLHLVHVRNVYRPPSDAGTDPERAYLAGACERVCDELGESVSFAVLVEPEPEMLLPTPAPSTVADLIRSYAADNGVDLIAMATHGRSGVSRFWFGSVADALLRTSTVPVLLIRPEEPAAPERWRTGEPFTHVLVPLDASGRATAALGAARDTGRAFHARFTLLRVLALPSHVLDGLSPVTVVFTAEDTATAQDTAERDIARAADVLRADGAEVDEVVIIDPTPAKAILRVARERNADLIVVATRAPSPFSRFLMGSVTDKVVRGADCPVLVVRAASAEKEEAESSAATRRTGAATARRPDFGGYT